jgi:hypothetical protein
MHINTTLRRVRGKAITITYAERQVAQSVQRLSYGLDGPGIESRWGEIFRPSKLALGPTQPAVQWVPGLSRR